MLNMSLKFQCNTSNLQGFQERLSTASVYMYACIYFFMYVYINLLLSVWILTPSPLSPLLPF